jgi:hypothetical protein
MINVPAFCYYPDKSCFYLLSHTFSIFSFTSASFLDLADPFDRLDLIKVTLLQLDPRPCIHQHQLPQT